MEVEENFIRGVSDGRRTRWYDTGVKKSSGEIRAGELVGTFREWHPNGTLARETPLEKGVAHGEVKAWDAGGVELGNLWLSNDNLAAHASELAGIGHALTPGGDLLLYGCNVAAGQAGASFLSQLAQATGANIAASDDVTGSARFGGNRELEVRRGRISTGSAFVLPARDAYAGLLGVSSQNFSSEATGSTSGTSTTRGTWTFTSTISTSL